MKRSLPTMLLAALLVLAGAACENTIEGVEEDVGEVEQELDDGDDG